jgi:hypothetical protein
MVKWLLRSWQSYQAFLYILVQENQEMLKAVFIKLRKLWFAWCGQPPWQLATPSEPSFTSTRGADKTGVAYKERVTPWWWQLAAETCRGK